MPSICQVQQVYCKFAQFNHSLGIHEKPIWKKILLQIDDVNFEVPSNKSGMGFLVNRTLLHIACHHRHIEACEALLSRGADFTATNGNGYTALCQAFYNTSPQYGEYVGTSGSLENPLIKSLLNAHVDSGNTENPRSAEGMSHFHIACAFNHLEAVQLFLNSGGSLNEAVNMNSVIFAGYTPLHFAVRFCGYETAELLLSIGADVNVKDAKGFTPFNLVIERNLILIQLMSERGSENIEQLDKYIRENEKIIRLFLEDNRVPKIDKAGFSKFHAACTLSNSSLAQYWLRVVDANCAINVDSPIWPGCTPLHFAAHFNIEIVKLLLRKGANIEAKDAKGVTPFDLCMEKYDVKDLFNVLSVIPSFKSLMFSDGKTELLNFINAMQSIEMYELFVKPISKNLYLSKNYSLWPGYSLLHLAVLFSKHGSIDIAKKHFDLGGKSMIQDAYGRTPLHLAFYEDKVRLVDLFFEHQLGVADAIDSYGLSHLHIACDKGNTEAVRILLSKGARVNSIYKGKTLASRRMSGGSTPLHIAMQKRNVEIIKLLLKYGADANLIDDEGMAPIHQFTHAPLCVLESKKKFIKEIGDLLLSSCNLKNIICTATGMSYLHFASYMRNAEAVQLLLQFGADPNAVFLCKNISVSNYCSARCFTGYTPMHFTLENGDTKIIQLLLQNGADILKKKRNRMTLLYDVLSHRMGVLKIREIDMSIKRIFVSMLENDAALRKKVKDDSGLTLLHVACFLRDIDQIRSLLGDPQVDVNSQMHADSPIWPKATPLHLLIKSRYNIEGLEQAIKLLLNSGANVMLMDNECNTPVHIIWSYQKVNSGYRLLRLLLRHQTDFSINPVNEAGLSHFHLACAVSEYTIVEKFLENGIDVNLPIDYHSSLMTFQTPLHFMLRLRMFDAADTELYLKTMDVLLKYGADVNAEDEKGSTPFLEVARFEYWQKLFFQKLIKAGANVNCTDIYGHSILETLLFSSELITSEELQILLGSPNLFNTYNLLNGIGMIATIIDNRPPFPNRKFILEAIMKLPSIFTINSTGRTPIHNVVANPKTALSIAEYANYIEKFIKMGFNIDAQDSSGKTALHLAAYFHNQEALCGLLIAGADINVTDKCNQTLFAKLGKFHTRMRTSAFITTRDKLRFKDRIVYHIISMKQCGLEVNSENLAWANREISVRKLQFHRETIWKELEDTMLVKIGTGSLTLRDFLSETGAVASRPSMICDADREAVDKFFESIDNERFPELSYLFKLQYRKMLKRLPLMEAATHSVKEILGCVNGFFMPDICCRMILRFLTNTEVKHLILCVSKN